MEVQAFAYEVAQRYVLDNAADLPADLQKRVLGWIRSRSFKRLASCLDLFDPEYHGSTTYRFLLQIGAFFKKNADFAVAASCEAAAHKSFARAERICRITNRRLDYYYERPDRLSPDLALLVAKVPKVVEEILGPFTGFLDTLPELVRLTSGASSTSNKAASAPTDKLVMPIVATSGATAYIEALAKYWGYDVSTVETTCNRISLVPKNWKTHRTIACEPAGNMPLQLAFDAWCKKRLIPYGVDLSSQLKNQEYARLGSISGHYTTLDLEMASDTVAYNAVAFCLPCDWFKYLNAIRSKDYAFERSAEGHLIKAGTYAKFSSMGNGSTFGIETLIFTACCLAAGSRDFCVYGDDIIVEPEHVARLLQLLKYFGFLVNAEKSHFDGPIRESCGSYWFKGVDVNPFYLRTSKGNTNKCLLINSMVDRTPPNGHVWNLLKRVVTESKLPLGPFDGDPCGNVWITCRGAYRKHLIRTPKGARWIAVYKKYVAADDDCYCYDERSLFLWHVAASRRGRNERQGRSGRYGVNTLYAVDGPDGTELFTQKLAVDSTSVHEADIAAAECIISSTWSASEGYTVRKRVQWLPPTAICSSLMHAWEEYLDLL